jgi:chaperonin GroES
MKLRALHAIIAVKLDESPDHSGNIYLIEQARESVDTGTVVAAGPGEYDNKGKFTPTPISEGDRVLIARGSGTKLKVEGEEYVFLTPAEITGIIKEDV